MTIVDGQDVSQLRRLSTAPASRRSWRLRGLPVTSVAIIVISLSASLALAPPSVADPAVALQSGAAALRGQTSCPPLRYNKVVEQAAGYVNRSTDQYLDRTAKQVPITEPLPLLKDLGYVGTKARLMQGAMPTDAQSIKGTLLQAQAYAVMPDCNYTDFGVDRRQNKTTGLVITSLVVAGP